MAITTCAALLHELHEFIRASEVTTLWRYRSLIIIIIIIIIFSWLRHLHFAFFKNA